MLTSSVLRDLSAEVLAALQEGLPHEGLPLVDHVEVSSGRGTTHLVSICSGMSEHQVGNQFQEAVHRIVAGVMCGRRHVVRIIWA